MKEIGTARPNAADIPSVLQQGNAAAGLGRQWEGEGVHCPSLSPRGVSNYPGSQQSHMELHCSGGKRQELQACPQVTGQASPG